VETLKAARRAAGRLRQLTPYWIAVSQRASLAHQVELLPRLVSTRLRWIRIADISLETDVRRWRGVDDRFAIDGDWDRTDVSTRPSIFDPAPEGTAKGMTHECIRDMFLKGRSFRETRQYAFMVDAIREAKPQLAYGCRTLEEVDRYFETLEKTHAVMKKEGYLSQRHLGGNPADEVRLYITREGRWCHGNGGNHRIRIAELLQIDSVPFLLAGAHTEWITRLARASARPPRAAILRWMKQCDEVSRHHNGLPLVPTNGND
jgi:hypothetical protein